MFTRDEVRWFSDTVRTLYAAESTAEFVRGANTAVHERFRLVVSAGEELASDGSFYELHGIRTETRLPADHAAFFHDCPLIPVYSQTRPPAVVQMREIISLTNWERTDHFNGIARPMGWSDMFNLIGQTKPTMFHLCLLRDKAFLPKERELLRHLQPHVAAVWARVHQATGAREPGRLRIMLSSDLRPYLLSGVQRFVLRSYFPRWRENGSLPAELQTWAAHSLQQLQHEPPPLPLHTFAVESARGRLIVRFIAGVIGRPMQLFLIEKPVHPDFFLLRLRGLTSRECEVLHWLAQGKRDAEIAVIIGCAPSTVSKHVEHVIAKLHAENRGAAVTIARGLL